MYYYHYPMMDGFHTGWGLLLPLLLVGLLVFVAVITTSLVRHNNHTNASGTDPLAIIKERYAKGEINKEQFEQLKKDLK